jgi:deoxyhypusine synthase
MAALLDGAITRYKAEIITRATALLDDAEARAAEDKVLDRAGRLTPGGLRAAIAHAVMEVAPREGEGAAGTSGEGRAGGAVGRGLG